MKALENKTLIILRISSYYYIISQTTADVISLWLSGVYFTYFYIIIYSHVYMLHYYIVV